MSATQHVKKIILKLPPRMFRHDGSESAETPSRRDSQANPQPSDSERDASPPRPVSSGEDDEHEDLYGEALPETRSELANDGGDVRDHTDGFENEQGDEPEDSESESAMGTGTGALTFVNLGVHQFEDPDDRKSSSEPRRKRKHHEVDDPNEDSDTNQTKSRSYLRSPKKSRRQPTSASTSGSRKRQSVGTRRMKKPVLTKKLAGASTSTDGKGKGKMDELTDEEQSNGDAEENNERNFTVYVQVETSASNGGGKGAKALPKIISKGPFKCSTYKSFAAFQQMVTTALSCTLSMLQVSKFEWKFDNQAQSAPRKKLGDHAGYEALLDAIRAKRATDNIVVWLYTPKPTKRDDDWDIYDTVNTDHEKEVGQGGGLSSSKARMDDISRKSADALAELEAAYPIGQVALFPDKRVWHNKANNTYFELTPLKLKFWATHIAAGKAGVSAPPSSRHFNDTEKLRVPPNVPMVSNAPPAALDHQNVQQALPYPPVPAPMPYQMPGYPYHYSGPPIPPYYPYGHAFPPYYPPPPGPPQPGTSSAMSSPGVTTSHDVDLPEFCRKYGISKTDQDKLAALEYRPGNRAVEKLDEREWREIGKFTKLGWDAFLKAHKIFCAAIKAGTWAAPE